MKRYIQFIIPLLLLLFFIVFNLNAHNKDSLINLIKNGDINQKINANISLSNYYFYSIPDTAEHYLKQALIIAKKENLKKKEGVININLGILYNEKGLTLIAEKYFKETIEISKEISDSTLLVAALGNMGNSAMYKGNYTLSLEYFTQVADIYEKTNNNLGLGNTYGAIGNIYIHIQNYDKALIYYNKSKEYFLSANDTLSAAIPTLNCATIYSNKEQYKLAESKYKEALEVFRKHQQKLNEAECLGGLAIIYKNKNEIDKSYKYSLDALKIYKKIDAKRNLSQSYAELGGLQILKNNISTATKYYDSAYNISYELKNYPQLAIITEELENLYAQQKLFSKAYEYSLLNKSFSDSVISIESVKKFKELEVKFETKQKEQQIKLLTKEKEITEERNKIKNLLITILIISFISVILFFLLLINRRKLIEKQKQILGEQKLNRLQMNPHFIYNTLVSVQNFMLENDSENSVLYMSKFAKLMRDILESTQKDFINLDDELEIIELYIDFQKLRSENKFEYIIEIDPNIDTEATLIPPMIIQPFIENSIKYAFNDKIKDPKIKIKIDKIDKKIKIKISDNGVGIKSKKNIKKERHNSLAISITKNRLKNMYVKKSVNFNIQDISEIDNNQTGTIINILIPEKLNF